MNQQPGFDLPEIDPRFNPNLALDDNVEDSENDKRLMVSFRKVAVMSPLKSSQAGRAVYDEIDYITIRTPGNQLSVIEAPVTENNYQYRFQDRYQRWLTTQSNVESGTPLESFPYLLHKVGMLAELKAINVVTVEQLANISDTGIQGFMGGRELRKRAKEWLDTTTGTDAQLSKMAKENSDMQQQMLAMKTQMDALLDAKSNNKPILAETQEYKSISLPMPTDAVPIVKAK